MNAPLTFLPVFFIGHSKRNARGSQTYVRKGLVVTQFAISMVLIVATLIVYQAPKAACKSC